MPNWCYNTVVLECPDAELYNKLLESMQNSSWFSTFSPVTTTLDDEGNECWDTSEAIEKWGTKWEANELEVIHNDIETFTIQVSFDSAWSPPLAMYETMKKNYKTNVTAYYCESCMDFFGKYELNNLREVDDSFSYPSNKQELEELKKNICPELNDFMECEWERLEEMWEDEENNQ